MNASLPLAAILLAAPAFAGAGQHTIVVSMSNGRGTYAHTTRTAAGEQANYVGKSGGKNVINNFVLGESAGQFTLEYQMEVAGGEQTFQVQGSLRIKPGERVRAVECGNWKLDVSLDAAGGKGAPSSAPSAPNLKLTTTVGPRTCKAIVLGDTQTNIVDAPNGRKSAFLLNAIVASPSAGVSNVQYQLESPPAVAQAQGEAAATVGKKTSAQGGKVAFLLEAGAAR